MPKYTMKPGAKKRIEIKIKELHNLKKLMDESHDLARLADRLNPNASMSLMADIKQFRGKVIKRINILKKEIKALRAEEKVLRIKALQPLIKKIQQDCKTYVAAFRAAGSALYRGSNDHGAAFVGRSWEDRRTLDSSQTAQEYYDAALKMMGIKALRSNSIFTTGRSGAASSYGQVYVIFPKDGANFSWASSNLGRDNTLDISFIINGKALTALEKSVDKHLNHYSTEVTDTVYDDGFEALTRFLKKIKYPGIKNVTIDKIIDLNRIKKMYKPTDKDLTKAIRSGHEVLISGEYYAVKFDETGEAVLDALGIKHPSSDGH